MKNTKIIGGVILPLRLVTAWLFLAAVLRRLVLAPGKHDIESVQWIGHKINTFFPQANFFFYDILEYLSRNPIQMNWFSYVFTYSELIVGVLLLLGLSSRLTGFLLINLGVGLMHTAGWLGPTCLDEWQIASLLTTVGVVLLLFGSGSYSLDTYINQKGYSFTKTKIWIWITDLEVLLQRKDYTKIVVSSSLLILFYVIGTNQLLHGGVWGKLRNDSVKPHFVIDDVTSDNNTITFSAFRDKGPETYGAFVIEIQVLNQEGKVLKRFFPNDFKQFIYKNIYINEVKYNKRSLVFPLGSKAILKMPYENNTIEDLNIKFIDISGKEFISQNQ